MKKFIFALLLVTLVAPLSLFAQTADTVVVPNDNNQGTINTVIQGDTTATGARNNPNRVYELVRGGYYLLNGWITVKAGTQITIIGAPPPASGTDPGLPVVIPGVATGVYYSEPFDCYGDLTLKNIWLFYVDNSGAQSWNQMTFENTSGLHGTFDNVIFDWDQAPAMHILGKHFTGIFTNCIFRNDIDPGQWWSGRQIYFESASSGDSVGCENNTFENMGFTFQTQGIPVHRIWFNHNTFLNVAKFALQESYWTWLVCTNNVFVNGHFTGERYSDRIGQDPNNLLYGAVLNVDTLVNNPTFDGTDSVHEMQRVIIFENNSNYADTWFQPFFTTYNDTVTALSRQILPEPLMNDRSAGFFDPEIYPHPLVKMANIYDSTDPGFTTPATNKDSILTFLQARYTVGGSVFWGYNPDLNAAWPLMENLTYSNTKLLTAGTDGLPLGDLYHWFPTQYATWLANRTAYDNAIWNLTDVKEVPNTRPTRYALLQNYPNPFNPTTNIRYSVPQNGYVTLKIYNVLGQEVATLFSGVQHAGDYVATFDASRYASGIYFYRLQAGNTSLTKKMVLLK
ncbi:MAG TPA: T9SS type A sorting domain-containing protein [Candidatus Acidoferrales bacterium]|nr:T9SS type A sorting domain-containing protein [Candidatus Acidoferrales bacterium]